MNMVRNSLLEDGLSDQLREAIFEPKMTRSKMKEALKEGNVGIFFVCVISKLPF